MKRVRLAAVLFWSYCRKNWRLFGLGLGVGILLVIFFPRLKPFIFRDEPETIGLVGNFTVSNLPRSLQEEISFGLVRLLPDGTATAAAALNWEATDSGKTIRFTLNKTLSWQDGQALNSSQINYNLRGVTVSRPADNIIEFKLPEPFSPLITLLSQPLFKDGLIGLGSAKVGNINFAGRFLAGLEIKTPETTKIYKFFPSEQTAVTALKLGSVQKVEGLHQTFSLENSRSYLVTSQIQDNVLAVIFFNLQKAPFDEKSFRQSLTYALPDEFFQGEAAAAPLPRHHWTQSPLAKNYPHSQASVSAKLKIVLSTNKELEETAKLIAKNWQESKIPAETSLVETPPLNFDAYLTYLELPVDPDQYALWHSTQQTNIAGYKSFKVDRLLEEGRRTLDPIARKEIYAQWQKAITEDAPAAFLFYPKIYTIERR